MDPLSLTREHAALVTQRQTWESLWQETARYVLPRQALFNGRRTPADYAAEIFDDTAPVSLERFAAAMESMVTPRTQRWHSLRPTARRIAERSDVKAYLEAVRDVLFDLRYAPGAGFGTASHEAYLSVGAFGTACIFTDDLLGRGIRYRAVPLAEIYVSEDAAGLIDRVHRAYQLTARAAAGAFPDNAKLAEIARDQPQRVLNFVHCCYPNPEREPRRADHRGMAVASRHLWVEEQAIVREAGYRSMPYAVSRHLTQPGELYGRSPAMMVLPSIKLLNRIARAVVIRANRDAEPTYLSTDDNLPPPDLRPNAVNPGFLDEQGRQLLQPLPIGGDPLTAERLVEERRAAVRAAFYESLFAVLAEQPPQMTATEALLREQEKGALIAPTMGRQQGELLGPIIARELDIAAAAGLLPEMPDALAEIGGDVAIEYSGPLTRILQAEDGTAIARLYETLPLIAQHDPEAAQALDSTEAVRVLARSLGVPAALIRDRDTVDQIRQATAEQQQMAAMVEAAPKAAAAIKDLASASAGRPAEGGRRGGAS